MEKAGNPVSQDFRLGDGHIPGNLQPLPDIPDGESRLSQPEKLNNAVRGVRKNAKGNGERYNK